MNDLRDKYHKRSFVVLADIVPYISVSVILLTQFSWDVFNHADLLYVCVLPLVLFSTIRSALFLSKSQYVKTIAGALPILLLCFILSDQNDIIQKFGFSLLTSLDASLLHGCNINHPSNDSRYIDIRLCRIISHPFANNIIYVIFDRSDQIALLQRNSEWETAISKLPNGRLLATQDISTSVRRLIDHVYAISISADSPDMG